MFNALFLASQLVTQAPVDAVPASPTISDWRRWQAQLETLECVDYAEFGHFWSPTFEVVVEDGFDREDCHKKIEAINDLFTVVQIQGQYTIVWVGDDAPELLIVD